MSLLAIALGIRQPILKRFAGLEQDLMQNQLSQVEGALIQQLEKLDSSVEADAIWTEMYGYLEHRQPEFYSETYPYEGMKDSIADVIGILDRQGQPLNLDLIDRRSQKLSSVENSNRDHLLKQALAQHFPEDHDLALATSRNLFIVTATSEPLMVAARPILSGDASGPRRGTLLMGIFINQNFLSQLSKHSNLELKLSSVLPVGSESAAARRLPKSTAKTSDVIQVSPHTRILDGQSIAGEIHLLNRDRQPIQVLTVKAPRLAYLQGEATLNQLTGVLFSVGISLGLIISGLLDKFIRNQQLLSASQAALQSANQELQALANLDGLTQIANRRCFDQILDKEWTRASREQYPLTLILCDVDYFKSFNDTYGHLLGDRCLSQVAQAISSVLRRPGDCAARYGGEEFAILLPNTPLTGGMKVAQAIQEQIKQLAIPHASSSVSATVSISIGVASLVPNSDIAPEDLIEQSDQHLYLAKLGGRNQIVFTQSAS
jgi:diguanylate cyclase (GGDEF)-like protein